MIEFALVLPMLIVLTMLVVDFGRAFMVKNLVTQAAREGARRAAVSAPLDSVVAITTAVAAAGGLPASGVVVTRTFVGTDQVKVTVQAPFTWLYPGLFKLVNITLASSGTLTASCTMYLEPTGP